MTWPENPAFVMFARDKAPWVAQCVRSVLAQTYSPMTFVFSDQGSTDGTKEAIEAEVRSYNGPNKVVLLSCPETEDKGMPGLIAHINWLHSQLDYDFWITIAADDIALPDRAKRTIETLRELDRQPLFFATAQIFANESDLVGDEVQPGECLGDDGEVLWGVEASAWPKESKWIEPIEHIDTMVGGSSTNAWKPELVESLYPLPPFSLVDVYVPFCAALVDSFYYLKEDHHIYVRRPDPNNTGIEGRVRLAANETERMRYRELAHFGLLSNALLMYVRAKELSEENDASIDHVLVEKTVDFLMRSTIFGQALSFAEARGSLTLNRIPPMPVPI